jgi:hypothetical protein
MRVFRAVCVARRPPRTPRLLESALKRTAAAAT